MEKTTKYKHLNSAERKEISFLLEKGYGPRNIAKIMGRGKSSIAKEVKENSTNGTYDPKKAQHKAYVKRKYSKYQGMKVVRDIGLRNYVEENIKRDWSPDEIAGRLRYVDKNIKYASRQAVYKFIYSVYGRPLERYLRYKGRKRKGGKKQKADQLPNRIFIEKRPKIVLNRGRYGDWEGDLIVSGKQGKGVLLVLHERKSRYPLIEKIDSRKTDVINRKIYQMTGIFVCFRSLTIDNDISFTKHEQLSVALGAPIYFCHQYHAWEKGGVENTNKLIRQYVPKGSDISGFNEEYIKEVETKLQNRPRKCLRYKTPLEVMLENKQFKTLRDFGIINKQKTPVSGVLLEG